MKKILLTLIFCSCFLVVIYAADETTPAPAATDSSSKIKELEEQEKKLALEMYKLRIEIIKKDQSLLRLHKQIIAMHKELALKVDNKKEMRIILNNYNDVTRQLEDAKAAAASKAEAAAKTPAQ